MLVAMTYSAELFMCILSGMILGHGLFNSAGPVGETVDPCCAGSNGATATSAAVTSDLETERRKSFCGSKAESGLGKKEERVQGIENVLADAAYLEPDKHLDGKSGGDKDCCHS